MRVRLLALLVLFVAANLARQPRFQQMVQRFEPGHAFPPTGLLAESVESFPQSACPETDQPSDLSGICHRVRLLKCPA